MFISIVPKEAPKKIFRYKTYVARGTETSANVSGIYGLMDEFSAYKNSTRASVEAANTVIKLNDKEKIEFFEKKAIAEYFAYYEFRLFIAWYLEYAAKNKPDGRVSSSTATREKGLKRVKSQEREAARQ